MVDFDADLFLWLIERYLDTHSQVVPTMFVRLLKLPPDVRAAVDVVVPIVRPSRRTRYQGRFAYLGPSRTAPTAMGRRASPVPTRNRDHVTSFYVEGRS